MHITNSDGREILIINDAEIRMHIYKYEMLTYTFCAPLSPFSTRRICSRDAKRKQESGNVIG